MWSSLHSDDEFGLLDGCYSPIIIPKDEIPDINVGCSNDIPLEADTTPQIYDKTILEDFSGLPILVHNDHSESTTEDEIER